MAWHTPCDLCSHTPRVAEKYCRYPTRRATQTCRPSAVTLLASTRPYTQPAFNIPEASAHPVLCPTHRPSHRLKDHPKVANSHIDMAPRVSPEHAAIYTHFHVPSCSRLGPGSRCHLVSHTPSCKASPPRSHSGSNVLTLWWVAMHAVSGHPEAVTRSFTNTVHNCLSQPTIVKCHIGSLGFPWPYAAARHHPQTLPDTRPPPPVVLDSVPHRLTRRLSGLRWFYFTKALKVQARGWLGPRGLGCTDCWLHRRGTPPLPRRPALRPQELSGATTVVVVVGGTAPAGNEPAGEPNRGPGKGMRWLTGPDSTTGPKPW